MLYQVNILFVFRTIIPAHHDLLSYSSFTSKRYIYWLPAWRGLSKWVPTTIDAHIVRNEFPHVCFGVWIQQEESSPTHDSVGKAFWGSRWYDEERWSINITFFRSSWWGLPRISHLIGCGGSSRGMFIMWEVMHWGRGINYILNH